MGADVHIVLGRINFGAVRLRQHSAEPSANKGLALFGEAPFEPDDFTLEDVPSAQDLNRNYDLFAWLANVRGSTRPLIEDDSAHKAQTMAFIKWLDAKRLEQHRAASGASGIASYYSFDEIEDKHDIGDHSRIIHVVNTLTRFDYDQVMEERNYDSPDDDWDSPVYMRCADGQTYRECFGEKYFQLLDYCTREQWHFILFGFDN